MKIYQICQAAIIMSVGLWLASCAHKPMTDNPNGIVGADGASGANAYAANINNTFQVDGNGQKINPLTAPANQIYYFGFDTDSVAAGDMQAIMVQANYLVAHPAANIRLEGNTDERGSREYNVGLAYRRDQAVARIFEQQGVQANQIELISYGKERPVAFGHNEHAWKLNRRVNLKYKVAG